MVKFTSPFLVAALVAAPVFASANWDELDTRDVSERQVFGREMTETEVVFAREADELFARVAEDLAARDAEIQDLSERSKVGNFFKKVWGGIKKIGSIVARREDIEDDLVARGDDELEVRELDELLERRMEEIEERTPGFLDYMTREFDVLTERDFAEEVYEREFEDEDLLEREIDELD
jgi:hypothetical protein